MARIHLPAPQQIIQDIKNEEQDDFILDDISVSSSGNIAVSGVYQEREQSYVRIYGNTVANSDSRDEPILLYYKSFTDKGFWPSLLMRIFGRHSVTSRYVSFNEPNSTEIVTCRDHNVQVIDYERNEVLRSRKVNGETTCLYVSESQIFIGFSKSDMIYNFDNDLNESKRIRMKGLNLKRPADIAVAADRLCVCATLDTVFVYSQESGRILKQYTTGQHEVRSIAANKQLGLIAVLLDQYNTRQKRIIFYPLSENESCLIANVESSASRIRISDQGRIAIANYKGREVKIYNLQLKAINKMRMVTGRYEGDFEEIKELGSGEFGKVTEARHKVDGHTYAVKRVTVKDPNIPNLAKIRREVELLATISMSPSSGVVRYYTSWFEEQDSPVPCKMLYIKMELCTKSLRQWLTYRDRNGDVNDKENIRILSQILKGMECIHQQEIVHRDLKPRNVFFTKSGDVKIGDLGLAKKINGSDLSANVGTPLYMAPEVEEGKNYDTKADMYSFGIIKYEMFQLFKTPEMRRDGISKLKEGTLSGEFHMRWPKQAVLILRLTSRTPSERPSASAGLREIKPLKEPEQSSSLEESSSSRDLR